MCIDLKEKRWKRVNKYIFITWLALCEEKINQILRYD